ncbi:efflux RND transporter permease subunit [Flocculibacter collagenilyticus]|uniref:efflux RND transporter permease subunit n=1 Tax=Flocculibacter collagenilyticus TaxID=2744479 RepID=UPI0018F6A21C|nr:efflux RND transporter permease subunit [Flocculibacter collagenilyticus]
MDITKGAIKNPTAVGIMLAITLFIGLYCLTRLPVQLFPDIERPQISIQTFWRAASPQEIEAEIVEPQEDVLQGLPGLKNMGAWSNRGAAWINLEFNLETDMQKTLIDVISRMNRLPPLPRDATPPTIMLGGWGGGTPALTYFFMQKLPGTPGEITDYIDFIEDVVRPRLESLPGVARVSPQSGANSQQELQIVFDPFRANELGIDLTRVANLIGNANDVSGGSLDVGRRSYTVRFAGKYDIDQLDNMVLDWREGSPIKLGDIADISVGRSKIRDFSIQNGNPAISIRIDRENGANVLQTLALVKEKIDELNQSVLKDRGLTMVQSFDASVFIYRAINLVTSNLFLGILLAVGVLWLFLRQRQATMIIALTIPVSILSTFIVLGITGRSLNVISLAGLAFAAGMVLDAAIVVLENIVRYRQRTKDKEEAALKGTHQVWGALLASTATTIAIFIPVIFLKDVEGQLFADLALTIVIAVSISFLIAVTVLPAVSSRWIKSDNMEDRWLPVWQKMSNGLMRLTGTPVRRTLLIVGLITVPLSLTYFLMPKLDYLPPVKRDAVDAFFNLPAGANSAFVKEEVMDVVAKRLEPYMKGEKEPALKNYYILMWQNGGTIGIRAKDQSRVDELQEITQNEILKDLPDTRAFAQQGNLFGGFGGGRNVALHIQSADTNALTAAAKLGMELIPEILEGARVQPNGNLEPTEPELIIRPDDQRIMEVGLTRRDVGTLVRAAGDGLYVGEYFNGDKRLDIIFKAQPWQTPEELAAMPITTPVGETIQLGELVNIDRTVGPTTIQRIEKRRTVTLRINPPKNMTLQEVTQILQEKIEPQLINMLPPDGSINYGGSADSLKSAISNMVGNFAFALALLFILMAGLFKSLKDSLLVLVAVPLATVGGVLSLRLLNVFTFQSLDLLTMIGFIILLGLVVNNAILLVHQTRQGERKGIARQDAVHQALMLRLRPIFMSTLTSIFGMLPLLLMPGAGSVIYRGLAAVIVGGMCVSTLFTLVLLPSLLRLGEEKRTAEDDINLASKDDDFNAAIVTKQPITNQS